MRLKYLIDISVCALLFGSGLCHAQDGGALKLWYRQPAGAWTEALPVGNGRLAAMVFGTVRKEHVQLNEDTVWSGEKRDRSNQDAPKSLAQIRRLLVEGHPAQAQVLADKTMISIPRALPVYETLGDLWLENTYRTASGEPRAARPRAPARRLIKSKSDCAAGPVHAAQPVRQSPAVSDRWQLRRNAGDRRDADPERSRRTAVSSRPAEGLDGEVTGLRARGGLEVDVKWNDGLPGTATLRPTVDGVHVLRPPTGSRIREVRDGRQSIRLHPGAGSSASLPVKAGHVYSIQFERTGGNSST